MSSVVVYDDLSDVQKSSDTASNKSLSMKRQRSLTEGTKRLLLMGIEILAHRELEQEGLEMYVSEGHSSRSCGAKVFNVIRWILWILMILVNYADPIVSLCYGISNYSLKPIITWLSLAAILVSVLYAFTIKIAFSIACLIINIVLRVVVLQLRNGLSEFIFSRIFTILSFCLFGVVFLLEVIEEARNSCK